MNQAKTGHHPQRWLLICLLPSWVAFSWLVSKAHWYWNHRPDLQFGWIVLLLCGYLFWEAWEKRPAPEFKWRFPWVVCMTSGGALLFLVQVYQAAFGMNAASLAGLALAVMSVIAGNLGYAFGCRGLGQFGFAFAFVLIALPMPSILHNVVVGGLQSKIAYLNVELLNVIGIPAQRVGSLIRLPNCTVGVDEACSGIRSLQSTLMATLFIGQLTLRSRGLKTLLVFSGLFLAVFGNLGRSLILSYTANSRGINALEYMHDAAGWSILLFTATGVAVIAWFFAKLEKASKRERARHSVQEESRERPGITEAA